MKYSKTIATLALLCLCLFSRAQATQLVYIRIQEEITGNLLYNSYIQITYHDQSTKLIDLKRLSPTGKGSEENGKIIQQEVSRLLNQGYQIISASTGSNDAATTTTLFLSRKEPE